MIPHHISDATFAALGVDRMISLVAVIENGGFSAAASVLWLCQLKPNPPGQSSEDPLALGDAVSPGRLCSLLGGLWGRVGLGAGGFPDGSGGVGVEDADADADDDVEPAGGEPDREDVDEDDGEVGEGVVAGG